MKVNSKLRMHTITGAVTVELKNIEFLLENKSGKVLEYSQEHVKSRQRFIAAIMLSKPHYFEIYTNSSIFAKYTIISNRRMLATGYIQEFDKD